MSTIRKYVELENRLVFVRDWGRGEKELGVTANDYRISFWNDENLLILDSGDGGTDLWIHQRPLNHTLEKGGWILWYVNFIPQKLFQKL